jgi:hypothetical protein
MKRGTFAIPQQLVIFKESGLHKKKQPVIRIYSTAIAVLFAVTLSSCKRPEPAIPDTVPCIETIKVTQRNGVDVVQTISGLYLKAKVPGIDYLCGRSPETRHLVDHASFDMPWANGQFAPVIGPGYTKEQWSKLKRSEQAAVMEPWHKHGAYVQMGIGFGNDKLAQEQVQKDKAEGRYQDWWYEPAIPHKLYPIDLLPNWAVKDGPDPQAGIGPIKSMPTTYWAVRGVLSPKTKRPYTTFCDMNSPPDWDGKDHRPEATKALDPIWLIQATAPKTQNGNTCRGSVSADNGAAIGARLDVPGNAIPEIDKVYKAAAKLLSELIVE